MNRLVKCGTVLAGYALALLLAGVAVEIRFLHTQGSDAQASAGMYAFGDALLFIAVFSAAAVIPTGVALYFLRPCRWFWTALPLAALAIALSGVLGALLCVATARLPIPRQSPLQYWAALSVLRTLAAPLLAAVFVLSALIAPSPAARWTLAAAALSESAVAVYALLQWFVGPCFI
jgi:hypothetical protein